MIRICSEPAAGQAWIAQTQGLRPHFVPVLAFTETGLLPGISAAGATPEDRRYTALADGDFLYRGYHPQAPYPLPPLTAGASPVVISRAVTLGCDLPVTLVNAGLATVPPFPCIDLGGAPARCVTTGQAMDRDLAQHLWHQGKALADQLPGDYLILGECVVGGTTTALALCEGLGIPARGAISSSHRHCNHDQKIQVVTEGLTRAGLSPEDDPLAIWAAIGDPMQGVVAALAIAASGDRPVLLAGGTQMLAVIALIQAIVRYDNERPRWEHLAVGTTRWVTDDTTGNAVGLAQRLGTIPLFASTFHLHNSPFPQLRAYEAGFVKEGVGAGGLAIAAHLYRRWQQADYLRAIGEVTATLPN